MKYEPPPKTRQKSRRQAELFYLLWPLLRKLSTDDIVSVAAITFAYLMARLKGYEI